MSCILIGGCCWSFATIVFHEPSLSKQSKRISKQGSSSSRTAHCRTVYGKVLLALLSTRPCCSTPGCNLLRKLAHFSRKSTCHVALDALCGAVLRNNYARPRIFVLVRLCIVSCYDLPWATPFVPSWCFAYSSEMCPNNKRTCEDNITCGKPCPSTFSTQYLGQVCFSKSLRVAQTWLRL